MYKALFWSSFDFLTLLGNMCSGEKLSHKVELSGEMSPSIILKMYNVCDCITQVKL